MRRAAPLPLLLCALLATGCRDSTGAAGDSRAPTLHLQTPTANAVVGGDSVAVAGSAADDRGVVRLTYALNGGAEQTVEAGAGPSLTFGFTARGTALGANQLTVNAYDQAGNRGTATLAFTVRDTAPPVVRVESPGEGELAGPDSVTITGTVTDDRRVTGLVYALDGGAEQAVQVEPGRTVSFRVAARGMAPGEHSLTVTARDEGGAQGSATVAFTVGSAEVRLTAPGAGTTLEAFAVRLQGYVDAPVRVDSLTYSVNGGAERPFCVPSLRGTPVCVRFAAGRHPFTWEADSLPQGDVRIRVFAYGAERQRIGAGSVELRVDLPVRRYRVTPIAGPGGAAASATDLNERGQVVGHYGAYPDSRAFLWENGTATELGFRVIRTVLVGDGGQVALNTYPDDECEDLFTWTPGEGLPVRVGECNFLRDFDGAGRMLVLSKFGAAYRAALLTRDTLVYLQGGYLDPRYSNDAGQVVGTASEVGEAWLFPDRPPQPLGTPCTPRGLNDAGQVLCQEQGGFVLTGGAKAPVAGIGREGTSRVVDINDRGQVVGSYLLHSIGFGGVRRAFLWQGGRSHAIEAHDGEWEVVDATRINDAGVVLAQVVRRGTESSAAPQPALLTPEP